jgi:nucleoid-associated protein YgaU
MRKDVKLGFAIGGVLLAVLIVYVLVVPGGGDKRVASATGEASQSGTGSGVSLEPVAPTTPATQPSGSGVAGTPPPAPPVSVTPPAGGTDPFEQPEAVAGNGSNAKAKDVDWSKLLNDSQMLMVQTPSKPVVSTATTPPPPSASSESRPTEVAIGGPAPDITKPGPTPVTPPAPEPAPTPTPTSEQPAPPAEADNTGNAGTSNVVVDPPGPGSVTPPPAITPPANDTGAVTTTAADAGAQKTHVVQPGESFSTISMIAYGNPNLYAAIMRANPGVDPQKLRPGTKINIPPASEAMPPAPRPAAAPVATPPAPRIVSGESAQTAKAEQPIDPQTQYRVQAGDSLYSISKKLYGRGDRYLRIHEANKQILGEDANTLKAGMVLTLPEPPTAK